MFGTVTREKLLLTFVIVRKCRTGHIQPIISEHAGPILTRVSDLIDISVGMIALSFVLDVSWDVAMVTNYYFFGGGRFASVEIDCLQ